MLFLSYIDLNWLKFYQELGKNGDHWLIRHKTSRVEQNSKEPCNYSYDIFAILVYEY